jgi:hypothetical protein
MNETVNNFRRPLSVLFRAILGDKKASSLRFLNADKKLYSEIQKIKDLIFPIIEKRIKIRD